LGFYQKGEMEYASPTMRDLAIYIAETGKATSLKDIVVGASGVPWIASLRGRAFERILPLVLKGGVFRVRSLHAEASSSGSSSDPSTKRLTSSDARYWSNVTELKELKSSRANLISLNSSAAGLDGFLWDEELGHHVPYDATVASSHSIHMKGLREHLETVGWSDRKGWPGVSSETAVDYYWIVPGDVFGSGMKSPGGPKVGSEDAAIERVLRQHVLEIPLATIEELKPHTVELPPRPSLSDSEADVLLFLAKKASD